MAIFKFSRVFKCFFHRMVSFNLSDHVTIHLPEQIAAKELKKILPMDIDHEISDHGVLEIHIIPHLRIAR